MFISWGIVCAIYGVLVGLCVLLALIPDTRHFAYRVPLPLAFWGLLPLILSIVCLSVLISESNSLIGWLWVCSPVTICAFALYCVRRLAAPR